LGGMRAAVAGAEESERNEQDRREEARKAHILIIRSEKPQRKGDAP
jgi:hypothetical protein